jgi:hypothetical protein
MAVKAHPSQRRRKRPRGPDPAVLEAMRNYVPKRTNIHVIPQSGRWVVRREGARRASRIVASKADAVSLAEALARRDRKGELIIHRRDASVEERRPIGSEVQAAP